MIYTPGSVKHYPMIRLQGKWLKEMGFRIGDRIVVSANAGAIVINKSEGASSPAQVTLYPMV